MLFFCLYNLCSFMFVKIEKKTKKKKKKNHLIFHFNSVYNQPVYILQLYLLQSSYKNRTFISMIKRVTIFYCSTYKYTVYALNYYEKKNSILSYLLIPSDSEIQPPPLFISSSLNLYSTPSRHMSPYVKDGASIHYRWECIYVPIIVIICFKWCTQIGSI